MARRNRSSSFSFRYRFIRLLSRSVPRRISGPGFPTAKLPPLYGTFGVCRTTLTGKLSTPTPFPSATVRRIPAENSAFVPSPRTLFCSGQKNLGISGLVCRARALGKM